jgi:hypothetical protein
MIPFLLHLAVIYIPFLNSIFGLVPLSINDWKLVLMFSAPILILEELLKLVGRGLEVKDKIKFYESKKSSAS